MHLSIISDYAKDTGDPAPYLRRIAVENGAFAAIRAVFDEFGPEYLGLCYDAGHGNLIADGLDQLDALKERLISVHLHDNNRVSDQHKLLFSGTVDWTRLARSMVASAYKKCVSMEVVMHNEPIADEAEFLARTYATGTRFAQMLTAAGVNKA